MKDPLVLPAAAIAAGILVSRFAAFSQLELIAATGAFLVLGALALLKRSKILAGASCAFGFVCAGALTAVVHAPGPPPALNVGDGEDVILEGCVVQPPAVSGDRARFVLELDRDARAQLTAYVRGGERLPALRYGQRIEMDAKVRQPRNFGNPGAFDYVRYLQRRDIYWTGSGPAGGIRILPGRCGSRFQALVMDLRTVALDRIAGLYRGNDYNAGMMQAILIGESYQLEKIWTEDYRATGTFHALVISGTHVAVLAAFFMFLLRICFVPESAALLMTMAAGWLYALVTGWQAPCVRSAAGLTLFIIAGYFYRERRMMNLLAAVAIGFLVFDPEQLFEASFQLTFLAVGFLAAFASPLIAATSGPLARGLHNLRDAARDPHLPPRVAQFRVEIRLLAETLRIVLRVPAAASLKLVSWPARVALFTYETVAVSAIVQAGLALPMVIYFHRVGFSGLSANAFVLPLMGLVTPLGFCAVFTGWSWIAQLTGGLLWLTRQVVHWHAQIEPPWRVPTPPLWLAVAISGSLIAMAMARGKWLRGAAVAVSAVLLALTLWHPFAPVIRSGELEMTAVDVGQGESIFLALPGGKTMLVDGGGIPSYGRPASTRLDIGEDVVAPYLWDRGLGRVDVIAATHGHEDHIGGLPALIEAFRPKQLWLGGPPHGPAWRKVREAVNRSGTAIVELSPGTTMQFGGAEFRVLAPRDRDATEAAAPANNDSLVLRVAFGRHAFLLTGDIERKVENQLVESGELGPANVLKVPHHGSRSSSSQEFLDAVSPSFAVISAGFANSYGNPHRDVLERIQSGGAAVFRTDHDGMVTIRTDGKRIAVETHRELAAGAQVMQPAPVFGGSW